ncbi:hypothetical protein BDR22DRAFT_574512 [Usnea florida]
MQQTPWTQETSQAQLSIEAGVSGIFQHRQADSFLSSKATFLCPEQTISQHNTRSQTHMSTKGSTTSEKETFLPHPNPQSEIPPPPFDIGNLWEEVRDFTWTEIADSSYIDSMTSYPQIPQLSEPDVLQESITPEEASRKLSQALKTQHPGNKPDFAEEFKSEKQTQRFATFWEKLSSPGHQDFTDFLFPRRKISDESPVESSRGPLNADKSPERGLIVVREHNPMLYHDEKDKSDKSQINSIWFGISLLSLNDLPECYLKYFLQQTDGLSPDLDFFAGFLCVKFGDALLDAMRASWARRAKTVLLSHSSSRRCDKEDPQSTLAFVRSLKFFGYICKSSVVEIWEMKVNDYQNTKHSRPSTNQSSNLCPRSSSTSKQVNKPKKKHASEPARGLQPKTQSLVLSHPAKRHPVSQQALAPNYPLFLATYYGTLHLNTQQGVQDFIKFHFALMEWVQNGGYSYVDSAITQLWRAKDVRLVMSEPETIDFLKTVMQGAKPEKD